MRGSFLGYQQNLTISVIYNILIGKSMSVLRTNQAALNKENPLHFTTSTKKNSTNQHIIPLKFQKVLKETNSISQQPDSTLFSKLPKNQDVNFNQHTSIPQCDEPEDDFLMNRKRQNHLKTQHKENIPFKLKLFEC